jgi:cytochrome c oxidase subunit II
MVVLMRSVALLLLLLAAPQAPAKTVEISAERFAFTPSEIKTTVGTRLEITITSEDTTHGFRIVGTDTNVEVPKRGKGVATVSFTPAKPGRYTFECSHTCGAGHSFMRGVIVVTQ